MVLWPGVQFSHLEMSSLSNVMPASREKEGTDSRLSLLQHPWSVLCSHWKEQAGHSQIESHGLPYATPHLPCQAWNCLCKFTSYTLWSSEVRRTKPGQDILLWNVLDLLLSGAICNCSYSYTVRLAAASLLLSCLPSGPETDLGSWSGFRCDRDSPPRKPHFSASPSPPSYSSLTMSSLFQIRGRHCLARPWFSECGHVWCSHLLH